MAAASGSSLRFPPSYQDNEYDTGYFNEALKIFLRQSGYGAHCPFTDLTVLEQRTVLCLAQKLKREGQR